MSDWKAGMAFDSILQTPLDYYDVTYANGHTVRYEKERPHGKWIEHKCAEEFDGFLISNYECSHCHSWKREKTDFCPDCGAEMDEEGDPK